MKTKAHFSDLDLEVLNPIETKKVLGGGWDDYFPRDGQIDEVIIWGSSGGGDYGDWWGYDPTHGGNDYPSDWGGGGSGGDASPNGVLENPTLAELWWLSTKVSVNELNKMVHNKDTALIYGQTLPGVNNGLGDALRHAMWSAMDAADIGLDKAKEFHTLHENEHPSQDGSNAMDLHNNDWGFNWFQQNGNPDNNIDKFLVDFFTAVNNGQIQTKP
jgi:hypothetical protein